MASMRVALVVLMALCPSSLAAQVDFASARYLTRGFMFGMSFSAAPGFDVDATPRNFDCTGGPCLPTGSLEYPPPPPYQVHTGLGFQIGLHAGYALTPWFTPYANISLGRAGEDDGDPSVGADRAPGATRVSDIMYSELGARLNLAIPKVPVVPYVLGAVGYRSLSSHLEEGDGSTTIIYLGTDRSLSGGSTTLGVGLLVKAVDVFYLVSTGRPKAEYYETYGTAKTRRMGVGFTA